MPGTKGAHDKAKGDRMADYQYTMICPSCKKRDLNLLDYDSLMVLKPGLGLFMIECPTCSVKVSSIQPIPAELTPEINEAALQVGAGMGVV